VREVGGHQEKYGAALEVWSASGRMRATGDASEQQGMYRAAVEVWTSRRGLKEQAMHRAPGKIWNSNGGVGGYKSSRESVRAAGVVWSSGGCMRGVGDG
jgi:hypothetical protein